MEAEVIFNKNGIVGKNSKLFARHLGKVIRDRNIFPFGI